MDAPNNNPTTNPPITEYRGPHGSARLIELDYEAHPSAALTIDQWLITAPIYHPLWSQYVLCTVKLQDHPDFPPAHKRFPEATHELLVMALDPDEGPYTMEMMNGYTERGGGLPYLTPVNISEQFTATDEQARGLTALAVWAVVNGHLNPETADAPRTIRAAWHSSLTKTLAHLKTGGHDD